MTDRPEATSAPLQSERLAALEAQVTALRRARVLARVGYITLFLLLIGFIWSANQGLMLRPPAIEATRFVVVDAQGRQRATWGLDDDGAARLVLLDSLGVARLRLSVLSSGWPGIALVDDHGRTRSALGVLPDATNSLVFADAAGNTRIVLGVAPDETTTLVFADHVGQTRAAIGVAATGLSTLLLSDSITPESQAADSISPDSALTARDPASP
jgi:hypothetical protein